MMGQYKLRGTARCAAAALLENLQLSHDICFYSAALCATSIQQNGKTHVAVAAPRGGAHMRELTGMTPWYLSGI
jgi:hypothetical protein